MNDIVNFGKGVFNELDGKNSRCSNLCGYIDLREDCRLLALFASYTQEPGKQHKKDIKPPYICIMMVACSS